jgi:mannose-6-phosphate isomerase-like protein (cupin superfamily)
MPTSERYTALTDSLASLIEHEPQVEGRLTAAALRTTPPIRAFGPEPPCALDGAIRACLSTSPNPVAQAILAAQDLIPWGVNPVAANMTAQAAGLIAVSTLMGPEGPIPSATFRLGLVYMVAQGYYPLHNHDADETYVLLAGGADWTAGDDRRFRGAGDMVHHPSLMPHAFRTGAEGFVALWRWSGDINTHSYTFLPDPDAMGAAISPDPDPC